MKLAKILRTAFLKNTTSGCFYNYSKVFFEFWNSTVFSPIKAAMRKKKVATSSKPFSNKSEKMQKKNILDNVLHKTIFAAYWGAFCWYSVGTRNFYIRCSPTTLTLKLDVFKMENSLILVSLEKILENYYNRINSGKDANVRATLSSYTYLYFQSHPLLALKRMNQGHLGY